MEQKFLEDKDELEKGRGSVLRQSSSKPFFNETIFQKQKKNILAKVNDYKLKNLHLTRPDTLEKNKIILFNQANAEFSNDWEWSNYDISYVNNEYCPMSNEFSWNTTDIKFTSNGVDIKKLIFKSKESIKVLGLGINLDISASLKGESSLWIFTRDIRLNQNSCVIRINKEEKSQRMFISLGTYILDKDNATEVFKVFTKQQLVDFTSKTYNIFYYILL